MRESGRKIAVLDVGGTAIKSAVWENGKLMNFRERETRAFEGAEALMARMAAILEEYRDFDAVGVSTAGQVDIRDGSIAYANENLPGYTGMPVKQFLQEYFCVPCAVENDVNAAALGELYYGAGRGLTDFLCVTYGTGIGGAVILDGKLCRGSHFAAGGFGGIVTHPEKIQPGVEYSGCYETSASVTALIRRAQKLDRRLTDGKKVFEALKQPAVRLLTDSWIDEILYGLVTLAHVFAPPAIILGGGILGQDYIIRELRRKFPLMVSPQLADTRLCAAALGNRAGLTGAAVLCEQMCSNL